MPNIAPWIDRFPKGPSGHPSSNGSMPRIEHPWYIVFKIVFMWEFWLSGPVGAKISVAPTSRGENQFIKVLYLSVGSRILYVFEIPFSYCYPGFFLSICKASSVHLDSIVKASTTPIEPPLDAGHRAMDRWVPRRPR